MGLLHQEPGKLCDTIADYLLDKCKRFGNLLSYCGTGFLNTYQSGRSLQLQCIKNPPMLNDEARIKLCLIVLPLNSSYANREPVISLSQASRYPSSIDIDLLVTNPGSSPITFNSLGFNLSQEGEKIFSGCIGKTSRGCKAEAANVIKGFSSDTYNINFGSPEAATDNRLTNSSFILNGTYYYRHDLKSPLNSTAFSIDIKNITDKGPH